MNKLLKRVSSLAVTFALMITCVPFSVFASETEEVNIQFDAMGGEFVFQYESGFTDLNAPYIGIGVKAGKSSKDSGYNFITEPIYSGYTFKGWTATGRKTDGTDITIADTTNLMTTEEALAYVAQSGYENAIFYACWANSDGTIASTQPIVKTGVQFDVWDGSAKYIYNNKEYTLSAARYYVKNGESASDYGAAISDLTYADGISATFKGWTLEIFDNGNVVYKNDTVMTTAEALAYKVDETTYENCAYTFTAQWEMPAAIDVEFFSEHAALFTATNSHDANGPWSTDCWREMVYAGTSFKNMGYSVSDPVWDANNPETAVFAGWDMYGIKAGENEFSLISEKLTTEQAIEMTVDNTYTEIIFKADWNIKHIPGENKQEANYTDCGGGFKTEWYTCDICGEHVDSNGNKLEWEDPIANHTLGEKMAPNYTDCDGGFKTEWHICSVCEQPLDKDGNYAEYIDGTGHTDNNYDNICDICSANSRILHAGFSSTEMANIKAQLEAAVKTAINNNDYSAMKAIFGDEREQEIIDFVNIYNELLSASENVSFDVDYWSEVLIEKDLASDTDLKFFLDNAVSASGGKCSYIFAMDAVGLILDSDSDPLHGIPMSNLCKTQELEYTIPVDAKSNRTYYVYASTDEGMTFTKIAESAKGGSSVTFKSKNSNYIFALMYKDAAEATSTPTPTPAPVHIHSWSGLKSDASTHYYECSCGAKDEVTAHSYNTAGTCTACGYYNAAAVTPTATPEATPTPAPTATPTPEMPKEADTTVTEIVASEAVVEAVKETIAVSEGTATVDTTVVESVLEATTEEETTIVLPLAQATEEVVNKAEVSAEALTTVANAEKDVVIELTDVTVKLDAETVKAITAQAEGKTIEIRAVKAEHHSLSDAQKKGVENKEVEVVITAQIFSDGKYIGDFKGGKATIKLPFQPKEGREGHHYAVYFVDDNGETTRVPSEFVDGHMVFTTSHFSDYVIVYEGADLVGETETDVVVTPETPAAETSMPILPIVIVIAIVIIGGAVLVMKKKNAEE